MIVQIAFFTEQGRKTAYQIENRIENQAGNQIENQMEADFVCDFYDKSKCTLSEWTQKAFSSKSALIFVGAAGIAVRTIAPFVKDKLTDSPVIVVDEKGKFVIPILSGHVGGANELSRLVAGKIGATPVITTATDINDVFSIDVFAVRNHLEIMKKKGIQHVSSKLLRHEVVTISFPLERRASISGYVSEQEDISSCISENADVSSDIPENTDVPSDIPENADVSSDIPGGFIYVKYPPRRNIDVIISDDDEVLDLAVLPLRPRTKVLGVGCKQGRTCEDIERIIQECGVQMHEVCAIASIDVKKNEAGLIELAGKNRLDFVTYTAEELMQAEGEFTASEFVKNTVGVDNVCERAAVLCAGKNGKLIQKKAAGNGVTLAVAQRDWRISFG